MAQKQTYSSNNRPCNLCAPSSAEGEERAIGRQVGKLKQHPKSNSTFPLFCLIPIYTLTVVQLLLSLLLVGSSNELCLQLQRDLRMFAGSTSRVCSRPGLIAEISTPPHDGAKVETNPPPRFPTAAFALFVQRARLVARQRAMEWSHTHFDGYELLAVPSESPSSIVVLDSSALVLVQRVLLPEGDARPKALTWQPGGASTGCGSGALACIVSARGRGVVVL